MLISCPIQHLVALLEHTDPGVILGTLNVVRALAQSGQAAIRLSHRAQPLLRPRVHALATLVVTSDGYSMRNLAKSAVPGKGPVTEPDVSSSTDEFIARHRSAIASGSPDVCRLYVRVVLKAVQVAIALQSPALASTSSIAQQILGLIENSNDDADASTDGLVVEALRTLTELSTVPMTRRRLIEASVFDEDGLIMNGFHSAVEAARRGSSIDRLSAYLSLFLELVSSDSGERGSGASSTILGRAIDADSLIRCLSSLMEDGFMNLIPEICALLATLLIGSSASRAAFQEQNVLEKVFKCLSSILSAPEPDVHNSMPALQSLLRIVTISVQRSRVVIPQTIVSDSDFVRISISLWNYALSPGSVDAQALLLFATSCNVVSRFIQNRPRSLPAMHREGLTAEYFRRLPTALELSSRDYRSAHFDTVVKVFLDLVRSLAIHSSGLAAVLAADPIQHVVPLLSLPIPNGILAIGRSIEEWMRHYSEFEEPVLTAVVTWLKGLHDDLSDDTPIVNGCQLLKCIVPRHVAKFCAVNGATQLLQFASSPSQKTRLRIHGIGREGPFPDLCPPLSLGDDAGHLTPAADSLAEVYSWLAVQQARLPMDSLFERIQKATETITKSSGFSNPNYLWPFDSESDTSPCDRALEQCVSIAALHFYLSILLRILRRTPTFQLRQSTLSSVFASISRVVARVEWALVCIQGNDTLARFRDILVHFDRTYHCLQCAFTERGSGRSAEHGVFLPLSLQNAAYLLQWRPPFYAPVNLPVNDLWKCLIDFTAQAVRDARLSLLKQRLSPSGSRMVVNSIVAEGKTSLKRIVELWRWSICAVCNPPSSSDHPWAGGPSEQHRMKTRKTHSSSDAPTSVPAWSWPLTGPMPTLDSLLVELAAFLSDVALLPPSAFQDTHPNLGKLCAGSFDMVWNNLLSLPCGVVGSALRASAVFQNARSAALSSAPLSTSSTAALSMEQDDDEANDDDDDDDDGDGDEQENDADDDAMAAVGNNSPAVPTDEHRDLLLSQLQEMGFEQRHVLYALNTSGSRDFNQLMDWMLLHPPVDAGIVSAEQPVSQAAISQSSGAHQPAEPSMAEPMGKFASEIESWFGPVCNVDVLSPSYACTVIGTLLSCVEAEGEKDDVVREVSQYCLRVKDSAFTGALFAAATSRLSSPRVLDVILRVLTESPSDGVAMICRNSDFTDGLLFSCRTGTSSSFQIVACLASVWGEDGLRPALPLETRLALTRVCLERLPESVGALCVLVSQTEVAQEALGWNAISLILNMQGPALPESDAVLLHLLEDNSLLQKTLVRSIQARSSFANFYERCSKLLFRDVSRLLKWLLESVQVTSSNGSVILAPRTTDDKDSLAFPDSTWPEGLGQILDHVTTDRRPGHSDTLRLLAILRSFLRGQRASCDVIARFIIERGVRNGDDGDVGTRFVDIVVRDLLTIRSASLRGPDCSAEAAADLARSLRKAAQGLLVELSSSCEDVANAVFQSILHAMRRESVHSSSCGRDRRVARFASALSVLLRGDTARASLMIRQGVIPVLVQAMESLDLSSPTLSESVEGVIRALENLGTLDLQHPLPRDFSDEPSVPESVIAPQTVPMDVDVDDNESDVNDDHPVEMEEEEEEDEDDNRDQDNEEDDDDDEEDDEHSPDNEATAEDVDGGNEEDPAEQDDSEYDEDELVINDAENDEENRGAHLRVLDASASAAPLQAQSRMFSQHTIEQIADVLQQSGDIGGGMIQGVQQATDRLRNILDEFQRNIGADFADFGELVIAAPAVPNRNRRNLSVGGDGVVVRSSIQRSPFDELPWLNPRRSSGDTWRRVPPAPVAPHPEALRTVFGRQIGVPSRTTGETSSWYSRIAASSGDSIRSAALSTLQQQAQAQTSSEQNTSADSVVRVASETLPVASGSNVSDPSTIEGALDVEHPEGISGHNGQPQQSDSGAMDVDLREEERISSDQPDAEHSQPEADVPPELIEHSALDPPQPDPVESQDAPPAEAPVESTGLTEDERQAFLAALPPELQAEIMLQDSRLQAAHANPSEMNPSISADIDNASFIAALPDDIREEFLLSQDDNFLAALPPELMSEAILLRQRNLYSERDDFPAPIRRQQNVSAPSQGTSSSNNAAESQVATPLLPVRLVAPLVKLYTIRSFDAVKSIHRLVRIMIRFQETRVALVDYLLNVCSSPSYTLARALRTLRFMCVSSPEVVSHFLSGLPAPPINRVFGLLSVARREPSDSVLTGLVGLVEDVLSIFKGETLPADLSIPVLSGNAIADLAAITNFRQCSVKVAASCQGFVGVLCLEESNKRRIIREFASAVQRARQAAMAPGAKSWEVSHQHSLVLRNITILQSAIAASSSALDEATTLVIDTCVADLSALWEWLDNALKAFAPTKPSVSERRMSSSSTSNVDNASLERALQFKALIEARFLQQRIASTPEAFVEFISFCDTHRRILNYMCSRYPRLLSGSFQALLTTKAIKVLDFDNKRRYFRSQLEQQFGSFRSRYRSVKLQVGIVWLLGTCPFTFAFQIRRDRLFEDSYHQIRGQTLNELRSHMSVQFYGEEGMDAGGLTREWFHVMSHEIFNPNYLLFRTAANSSVVFQPNELSFWNPEHIDFFKFVGRFVGKAIYQGCLLDAYFTRSFYKHMLGAKPSFSDLESIDPDFYKSLKWILENPIDGVLDLTFSAETHAFGEKRTVMLKPEGSTIPVTDANKGEYVRLITELRTTTEIRAQIDAFVDAFHELIPKELISIFSDHELELLISGLPAIDIDDLRANTEYHGLSESSDVVQWFWSALSTFDGEEKALFIQFVTGTSKVPIGGFRSLQGMSGIQRFQIHKASGVDRLPSSHTCFNQLDLPDYSSPESLAEKLRIAIREGSTGFGFA